jgi:hypothetical protein
LLDDHDLHLSAFYNCKWRRLQSSSRLNEERRAFLFFSFCEIAKAQAHLAQAQQNMENLNAAVPQQHECSYSLFPRGTI